MFWQASFLNIRYRRFFTMKPATQLPSGSWRVQVYLYKDADGKRRYKSFTAPTRDQAEYEALEWKLGRSVEKPENITVNEAIKRYIEFKNNVLSPSTIKSYIGINKNYFNGSLGNTKLIKLNSTTVQIWISDMSTKVSPKTVRCAHALLTSVVDMFAPDLKLKTTLPAKKKPELYTPSDDDIKSLLNHIKGKELEIAVLLAAFGPMRRGEICALTSSDIKGNIVDVNKNMVIGPDEQWHIKQPKTYGSYRKIEFPEFVIERMGGIEGRIVKATPSQISNRFSRAIRSAKLPHFRFHDLRHYSASIMHAIGVPDQYILQRGGWISDNVMKSVYRNAIDVESTRQNKKINEHFGTLQHDMQHGPDISQ
jgi:integrase